MLLQEGKEPLEFGSIGGVDRYVEPKDRGDSNHAVMRGSDAHSTPDLGELTTALPMSNVVAFPIRPMMMVTDDDLRAIWMVQVMAMAGMTVGLGGERQNKQGYKCDK